MIGPVLYQELLLGARRNRMYVFRWCYAGWLILQVLYFYLVCWFGTIFGGGNVTAAVARAFMETYVMQQLLLLALATPAITAGAITDEKRAGTLQYLLTTDLTAGQLLVGKLLARSLQVLALALAGLPLLCFFGAFGGLEWAAVIGLAAVSIPPLLAIAAASLLAATWTKQTRDAVLGLYGVGVLLAVIVVNPGGFLDFLGLDAITQYLNPLYVLEPAWGRPEGETLQLFFGRLLGSLAVWSVLGLTCLGLAVWRLRPAYVRQLENTGRPKVARWFRAERRRVSDQPIHWKERQVEGLAPLPWLRAFPRWLGLLSIFLFTVVVCGWILWLHHISRRPLPFPYLPALLDEIEKHGFDKVFTPAGSAFFSLGILSMILLSLMVGIRCSGAVSGERERQSWEALLLTPLTERQLIRGKLWGVLGCSWPYLLAYFLPAVALSLLGGVDATFWIIVWGAVTWLAMYFVGAAGIWSSTRARSSWRSLLGTIGWAYVGGAFLLVATSPLIAILALFVMLFFMLLDAFLGTTSAGTVIAIINNGGNIWLIGMCLSLVLIFYFTARGFLNNAERRVGTLERTRHWDEPPRPRRRRRRRRREVYDDD